MINPGTPGVGDRLKEPAFLATERSTNTYTDGRKGMERAAKAINTDLEQFARGWVNEYDEVAREPIEAFCDVLLRGGKRLRGVLTMQSYYASGGTDPRVAIGAARVAELGQTYLLLVDDIQDKSDIRRGGPSAQHLLGRQSVRASASHGDIQHLGVSQAMNAALAGMHRADSELMNLPASDDALLRAARQMHAHAETTAAGQIKDIYNQASDTIPSIEDIEDVLTKKTSYYTFVVPLELGAILAGKEKLDPALFDFAVSIGCAYQIADDLIGAFGDEKQSGKSNNDDIREGKMTLISRHAWAHADDTQQLVLKHILGNPNATDSECNAVREIMVQTGAQRYCEERLVHYRDEAVAALTTTSADNDPRFIDFLGQVITYASKRAA